MAQRILSKKVELPSPLIDQTPNSIYIGQRNLTFNQTIIKEMIQGTLSSITQKHWSDCIDHVKQVEKVYWAFDIARDEMLEPAVITLSDEETARQMGSMTT